MFCLKTPITMSTLLILAMVLALSDGSRGVFCKANPAPPSPITDDQQQVAFKCAMKCLNAGDTVCVGSGFAMAWDEPGCYPSGTASGVNSDYVCSIN